MPGIVPDPELIEIGKTSPCSWGTHALVGGMVKLYTMVGEEVP